jgi:hypothetical protein
MSGKSQGKEKKTKEIKIPLKTLRSKRKNKSQLETIMKKRYLVLTVKGIKTKIIQLVIYLGHLLLKDLRGELKLR